MIGERPGRSDMRGGQVFVCSACGLRHRGNERMPMHRCPAIGGIDVPLHPEGTKYEIRANVREDYVGQDDVWYDENKRPIMSVTTIRDEGQDCTVLAPSIIVRSTARLR